MAGSLGQHGGLDTGLLLAIAASPYPYVMIACSALGMLIFQTGLQRCRVSIVGPVSNITGSVFFIVAGTWLFGERLPTDPVRLALRLAGILLAGLVVVILSRRPPQENEDAAEAVTAGVEAADGAATPIAGAA
jgi:multidrug transporter EmrE-like cation transporter